MHTRTLIGLIAAIGLSACGGPSANNAALTTEAAPPPTNSTAGLTPGASPVTADDPVVCCQIGAAHGSSTRSLCARNNGTEVPRSTCGM